jgi:hypothetical protein
MRRSNCVVALLSFSVMYTSALFVTQAQTVSISTDSTWRAINPKPPTGWNTDISFDDSDAAGWQFAVKDVKPNNHIWYENILSDQAPAAAWFRKVFTLDSMVDDNGSGGSSFDLTLDPSLFRIGENLVAIHGVDQYTPYHTVGMDLSLTIPEPATIFLIASIAAPFVLRARRTRQAVSKTINVPSSVN